MNMGTARLSFRQTITALSGVVADEDGGLSNLMNQKDDLWLIPLILL